MADFRDELHICRSKNQFGQNSVLLMYDWCQTTTDLTNNTVSIVASGMEVSLGTACKVIADWGNAGEKGIKLNIKAFLEADCFDDSCEY